MVYVQTKLSTKTYTQRVVTWDDMTTKSFLNSYFKIWSSARDKVFSHKTPRNVFFYVFFFSKSNNQSINRLWKRSISVLGSIPNFFFSSHWFFVVWLESQTEPYKLKKTPRCEGGTRDILSEVTDDDTSYSSHCSERHSGLLPNISQDKHTRPPCLPASPCASRSRRNSRETTPYRAIFRFWA